MQCELWWVEDFEVTFFVCRNIPSVDSRICLIYYWILPTILQFCFRSAGFCRFWSFSSFMGCKKQNLWSFREFQTFHEAFVSPFNFEFLFCCVFTAGSFMEHCGAWFYDVGLCRANVSWANLLSRYLNLYNVSTMSEIMCEPFYGVFLGI